MPRRKHITGESPPDEHERPKHRRALTPEGRENQMIALAIDKVEERMMNGTASAAEYVHYLKLASTKERLEKEKLELELELVKAKTEALQSAKRNEELFERAIAKMTLYQGHGSAEEYEELRSNR